MTDLLCPDSHPEDYASRGYQGTCVFFWLLLFVLSLRGFFSQQGEKKKDRRVYERLPGIFSSRNAIGKGKNRFGLSFCPSGEFVRGVRRARARRRKMRSKRDRRGRFFFLFSWFSRENTEGQKRLTLFFFSARRARNQQKPIYSNRTTFKRSTSRSTYTARHLHRSRLDYRQRRNARDNPRGRLDRRENKFG